MIHGKLLKPIYFVISSIALASCMVGPNFHTPTSPPTDHYTEKNLPKKTVSTPGGGTASQSQQFIIGQDISGEWWHLYHSSELDNLIRVGLANSPNIAAAKAALKQAHETLNAQFGNLLLPSVDLQGSGVRQQVSELEFGGGTTNSLFNAYGTSVNVSYALDFFGGARREIESLRSQEEYQRYTLIAAYLTLTSNIVTTAINLASLQSQFETTNMLIRLQEKQLVILNKQLALGGIAGANIYALQTQLAQTKALLPPIEKNMALSYHALAVLVGILPSNAQLPKFNLDSLNLPSKLPVSLPSVLVQQRPDIKASEALLHAASAKIGVATANLFPKITLVGGYGWFANAPRDLFTASSNIWNYGGQLLQPLFHGGALQAQRRAAIDTFDEVYAQYQQTILLAFQNVADTLRAIEIDAKALRANKQAEIAAKKTLVMTQNQFRIGGVSYLELINANTQYQQTKINRIQSQALRFADTAALFQALGGGWWNAKEVPR